MSHTRNSSPPPFHPNVSHPEFFSAAIPSGCLAPGILLRRHSIQMSHVRNPSLPTFHPDISHPESCPPTFNLPRISCIRNSVRPTKPPGMSRQCMCGGDDHLAWKRLVSSETCRGLRIDGGFWRSKPPSFFSFGVQSHGYFFVRRSEPQFTLVRHSELFLQFWCSEPLSLSSLTFGATVPSRLRCSDVVFDSLYLDRCLRSGWHLDIVMLLLLRVASLMCRTDSFVFGLPGSALEIHPARSALLDTWMPSCLSIWEVHLGHMCTIQLWIWTTSVRCATIDDLMTFVLRTCRAPDAHTGAYFLFWMRFTDLHGGYMCDDR
ncbi:hypothetical protein VitviT2T_008726 [Vitis vinifera]|uniref:Uncharacterized protein n=1 Tax=Vitis vinifera TaxID=29760 RepID=A0ABY9C3A9_VITVI|nr:hypothetical protein VitviT2T_008726 [Vitis vinifera]